MNFNTANNTFRQLMGTGLSYRVPLFQRDYSWGPDEWDDLWQDTVALFEGDPEPAHYPGHLVLQSADNSGYQAKQSIYQNSEFAITRKLAEDYDTWTPDKIRSRQAWMARQPATIWRLDFRPTTSD